MRYLTAVAIAVLLAGCATGSAPAPTGAQAFSGEVWTWDTTDSTVTLLVNGERVRIATTPEQLRTLQLHQSAGITGTVAPPKNLQVVLGPVGPVTPVPKGQPEVIELNGSVASVDRGGRLVINSERGPLNVWVATGADQRFKVGESVKLSASVQPVDLVPLPTQAASAPSPVVAPAASPTSEPGDHAVVTGRILDARAGGVLVVESPTGPIQVITSDSSRYRVGDAVQVRTTVNTEP